MRISNGISISNEIVLGIRYNLCGNDIPPEPRVSDIINIEDVVKILEGLGFQVSTDKSTYVAPESFPPKHHFPLSGYKGEPAELYNLKGQGLWLIIEKHPSIKESYNAEGLVKGVYGKQGVIFRIELRTLKQFPDIHYDREVCNLAGKMFDLEYHLRERYAPETLCGVVLPHG